MGKLIDLTGQKFGRLTVIKRKKKDTWGSRWLCKCSCGTEKIIDGGSLRSGDTKSCGCLQKEMNRKRFRKRPGLASMISTLSTYKKGAKLRNLKFEITEKQFEEITQKDCYYCGAKPSNRYKSQNHNGDYVYNGLDRIDNTKGYTLANVVPCCKRCNHAKSDLTLQEYKDWIEKSYNKIFGEKEPNV